MNSPLCLCEDGGRVRLGGGKGRAIRMGENYPQAVNSSDQENVSNYRPISLLPILSKIVEKVVSHQLLDFLFKNNLWSNSQHGFRPNLSTETALFKVTDAIYKNMDNKMISLLTLCDLSKAFESVSHSILLKKCASLNID